MTRSRWKKLVVEHRCIPASYFGLTVEFYNYDFRRNGGPIEAWPTQLGFPLTIVRSLAVWSPGDKSCCKSPKLE